MCCVHFECCYFNFFYYLKVSFLNKIENTEGLLCAVAFWCVHKCVCNHYPELIYYFCRCILPQSSTFRLLSFGNFSEFFLVVSWCTVKYFAPASNTIEDTKVSFNDDHHFKVQYRVQTLRGPPGEPRFKTCCLCARGNYGLCSFYGSCANSPRTTSFPLCRCF